MNVRLLRRPVGHLEGRLILRPLNSIGGITRTSAGVVLTQATAKGFRTATDVFVTQMVSDSQGRYMISTPDSGRYYVVAFQPGTTDATGVTTDNTSKKTDRTKGVGGVTVNTLVGIS